MAFASSLRVVVALLAVTVSLPVLADAKEQILATYQAMVKVAKFRISGTSTSKRGSAQIEQKVVWPDRFHVKTQGTEIIIVPGGTYMKQGAQWMRFPADMTQMVKQLTPEAMKQGYDNMTNIKDLGEQDLDGKTAHVYEYDTQATIAGITAKSHVKLWIDVDSNLPLRQETAGEAMGMSSTTIANYTFDPSLQVEAPL